MAGRKPGYRHAETTREKIRATAIVNRLQEHIESPKPLMDASQVNAAKALLNKVLPDLQATTLEHMGEGGGPIKNEHKLEVHFVRPDQDS